MRGTAEVVAENVAGINTEVVPLSAADAPELARIRAHSRLKMPDAVVLHLARAVHGSVMTFDQDLARAAKGYGVAVLGVTV